MALRPYIMYRLKRIRSLVKKKPGIQAALKEVGMGAIQMPLTGMTVRGCPALCVTKPAAGYRRALKQGLMQAATFP